jgi:Holliday junction DNA helicase RuvA
MLEFIEGNIISKLPQAVIIQTGGVGFRIWVSNQTLHLLPGVGSIVRMYVYLHLREDEMTLYGFISESEREFFNLLIQVKGIGPKVALAILSAYPVDTLKKSILFGDEGPLTSISGVGKKTAQRLILELKDKIGKLNNDLSGGDTDISAQAINGGMEDDQLSQAVAALLALGYSTSEVYQALPEPSAAAGMDVEDLIRAGLKKLAKY